MLVVCVQAVLLCKLGIEVGAQATLSFQKRNCAMDLSLVNTSQCLLSWKWTLFCPEELSGSLPGSCSFLETKCLLRAYSAVEGCSRDRMVSLCSLTPSLRVTVPSKDLPISLWWVLGQGRAGNLDPLDQRGIGPHCGQSTHASCRKWWTPTFASFDTYSSPHVSLNEALLLEMLLSLFFLCSASKGIVRMWPMKVFDKMEWLPLFPWAFIREWVLGDQRHGGRERAPQSICRVPKEGLHQ